MGKRTAPLREFLHKESAGGIVLLIAGFLGLVIANTPLKETYFKTLAKGFDIGGDTFYIKLTVLKFINYLLMSLFFFVVGLEIKRELTSGHLAQYRDAVMPLIAALGGMAVPALIYLLIAGSTNSRGWGVPVATDIALAVGLLTLLGSSVAPSLRTFLLGLAVIDDIGAILVIAFIYSSGVGFVWVMASMGSIALVVVFKKMKVRSPLLYLLPGGALWYFIYRSGVHPTLAGVILGLMTPNDIASQKGETRQESERLIERLERKLHPWSAFVVVPIFAFANTGVTLSINSLTSAISSKIAWGIFFGLVIGKPIGIMASLQVARMAQVGNLPSGASYSGLTATSSAAGIGFTVAIFIAHLAFKDTLTQDIAVIAVIAASLLSGVLSWMIFKFVKDSKLSQ
jgi:NhaA family Na+:H+ antiporter